MRNIDYSALSPGINVKSLALADTSIPWSQSFRQESKSRQPVTVKKVEEVRTMVRILLISYCDMCLISFVVQLGTTIEAPKIEQGAPKKAKLL